jgi:hypothetical protein
MYLIIDVSHEMIEIVGLTQRFFSLIYFLMKDSFGFKEKKEFEKYLSHLIGIEYNLL